MAVNWVRVRNPKLNNEESIIPEQSLRSYRRRGWRQVNEEKPRRGQAAETESREQREES